MSDRSATSNGLEKVPNTDKNCLNPPEWNCISLSIGFFILFGIFNSIEAIATSVYPFWGSISLGIFSGLKITAPFASIFVRKFKFKPTFIFSFVPYMLYVWSYYSDNHVFLMISSVLAGYFSVVIWSAQGSYITQCANVYEHQKSLPYYSQIGWFKSIFFTIFAFSLLVGFMFCALFFQFNSSNHDFFMICGIIILSSWPFAFILRPMPEMDHIQNARLYNTIQNDQETTQLIPNNPNTTDIIEQNQRIVPHMHTQSLYQEWFDPKFISLIGIAMFDGVVLGYDFGEFPPMIEGMNLKFYAMACRAATGMIVSYVSGKYVDSHDISVFILFCCCVVNVFVWLLLWFYDFTFDHYYKWILVSLVMGTCGYAVLELHTSVLYSKLLGNQPEVLRWCILHIRIYRWKVKQLYTFYGQFVAHFLSLDMQLIGNRFGITSRVIAAVKKKMQTND